MSLSSVIQFDKYYKSICSKATIDCLFPLYISHDKTTEECTDREREGGKGTDGNRKLVLLLSFHIKIYIYIYTHTEIDR